MIFDEIFVVTSTRVLLSMSRFQSPSHHYFGFPHQVQKSKDHPNNTTKVDLLLPPTRILIYFHQFYCRSVVLELMSLCSCFRFMCSADLNRTRTLANITIAAEIVDRATQSALLELPGIGRPWRSDTCKQRAASKFRSRPNNFGRCILCNRRDHQSATVACYTDPDPASLITVHRILTKTPSAVHFYVPVRFLHSCIHVTMANLKTYIDCQRKSPSTTSTYLNFYKILTHKNATGIKAYLQAHYCLFRDCSYKEQRKEKGELHEPSQRMHWWAKMVIGASASPPLTPMCALGLIYMHGYGLGWKRPKLFNCYRVLILPHQRSNMPWNQHFHSRNTSVLKPSILSKAIVLEIPLHVPPSAY
ncbi:uncharacterized protein BDR25DRAFT_356073 [Lindgomyces ingoldianus]|uniref:Uncharacterized protein n=1 Tax=Lindgomyces ingoldianus TaxID=673940 RepID=A0ACB6QS50_9PLEO|nr:uncharacterized protein BDR25DRAFT_356073 [Lindgomyces ingoldianus]KAF2469824.1 hypothetical protein BDR25DRAFT_356073 [Lindgomyces ingoldianus]